MSVRFVCPLAVLFSLHIQFYISVMYSLGTHVVKLRNEPYPKAVLVRYGSVACAVVDVMFVQSVFSACYIAVFLFSLQNRNAMRTFHFSTLFSYILTVPAVTSLSPVPYSRLQRCLSVLTSALCCTNCCRSTGL